MRRARPALERFARELGMHAIHRATLTRDDAEYGNACLTRIEPNWFKVHDISVAASTLMGDRLRILWLDPSAGNILRLAGAIIVWIVVTLFSQWAASEVRQEKGSA